MCPCHNGVVYFQKEKILLWLDLLNPKRKLIIANARGAFGEAPIIVNLAQQYAGTPTSTPGDLNLLSRTTPPAQFFDADHQHQNRHCHEGQ
jgi:hypothetical protein